MIRHHFTVDVEEYFQVLALEPWVAYETWSRRESRVAASTERLLDLLAEHSAVGTFFVLGWIAERHPELVRRIAEAGHEVASHGWRHRRVPLLTPAQFRHSVRDSKRVLEDLLGEPVLGYRAPNFSIVPDVAWALEILVEEGYGYDSSIFPVRRSGSGWPRAPRDPYSLDTPAGRLLEFPPATIQRLGRILPAGGGAYLRLLPYALVRDGLRDAESRGRGGTFYVHPWELDPDQPRLPVDLRTRVRHYGGLRRTEPRLRRLLREFDFETMAAAFGRWPQAAEVAA